MKQGAVEDVKQDLLKDLLKLVGSHQKGNRVQESLRMNIMLGQHCLAWEDLPSAEAPWAITSEGARLKAPQI